LIRGLDLLFDKFQAPVITQPAHDSQYGLLGNVTGCAGLAQNGLGHLVRLIMGLGNRNQGIFDGLLRASQEHRSQHGDVLGPSYHGQGLKRGALH